MKQENFKIEKDSTVKTLPWEGEGIRKPRILVAPLDWGLGHATRCIPIVYELVRQGCDVWLGGEGAQEVLLKQEFPELPFLALAGYRVHYGRSSTGTLMSMFAQAGKILAAIKSENKWLKKIASELTFDAVISDNRFGLFHPDIPSIFITHQLKIKSPLGRGSEILLQKRNYSYIKRFTEVWVPDEEGEDNFAGELSHPAKKPVIPLRYVGMLSRLTKTNDEEQKDHLLVILSGPEPQRSILENKIIPDIAHYPGTATIIRGLPGTAELIPSTNTIKFYNHVAAEELSKEMSRAEFVISRNGYSTVMDTMKFPKKTILIPTPGQTEQEYLAKYLLGRKIAFTVSQKEFSLSSALREARLFSYHLPIIKENNLQLCIAQLLTSLKKE